MFIQRRLSHHPQDRPRQCSAYLCIPLVSLLITKVRRGGGGAYSGDTSYWSMGAYSRKYGIPLSLIFETIVSRGDWLGNPANIKAENNGAVGYVGSSPIVHNPLFYVHKL